MIRLFLLHLVLFASALAHTEEYVQGSFLYSDNSKPAARAIRVTSRSSGERVSSSYDRGLRSPGRDLMRTNKLRASSPLRQFTTRSMRYSSRHNYYDEDENDTEARPSCARCGNQKRSSASSRIEYSRNGIMSTPANMRAPIWSSFARNFAACAPGCQPAQVGVHRAEDGRRSCHHSSRAIDVGAIICGGRTITAEQGGRFAQMVDCMRPKMATLYRQASKRHLGATQAHYDHAHFSIGCYGGTFY